MGGATGLSSLKNNKQNLTMIHTQWKTPLVQKPPFTEVNDSFSDTCTKSVQILQ